MSEGTVNAELTAELEETGRRYLADYSGALWKHVAEGQPVDYDALGFWSFPLMMMSGTVDCAAIRIFDMPAFHAMVVPGYRQYYADGWAGGMKIDQMKVSLFGPKIGIVETEGSRFRKDGSVLSTWTSLYMHRRTERGWKQIAIDATEPRRNTAEWGQWLVAAGFGSDA